MTNNVKIIEKDKLEALHTKELLSRRSALLKCEESFELSDRAGIDNQPSPKVTGCIEFKDTNEWKQAYGDLKAVLSTREHVPSKKEQREIRQAKAKASK